MLYVTLNEVDSIAILEPDGKLSKNDFKSAAEIIDAYTLTSDKLKGIIIHVKSFPGWDSFVALLSHLSFVKGHHKRVSFVAFATDSPLGGFAEHVANHFISAEIKHFPFDQIENAKKWIIASGSESTG